MVKVSCGKLPYHMWKPEGTRATGPPLFWIRIKSALFWLETCPFMNRMSLKSERLRASLAPTMVCAVIRSLLNLIYIWGFFFTLAPLILADLLWRVQFPSSKNQVCKKKSPNTVNSNIWFSIHSFSFETQVTIPKSTSLWKRPRWLCEQTSWKLPLNELNELCYGWRPFYPSTLQKSKLFLRFY